MFEVLGDAQAQAVIRQRNTDKTHCALLRDDCNFCSCLPFEIEGPDGRIYKQGSVCPNNPYVRFADEIARQEATAAIIERAVDLYRASKGGALGPDTPSVEITLAHVYGEWLEKRRTEIQWQATSSNSLLK